MRKGPDCDFDKRNISIVICDTDIRNGYPSHVGDRKTFEVMTSTMSDLYKMNTNKQNTSSTVCISNEMKK